MSVMRLELPDGIDLESRAAAAGFASIEDYVRSLIEQDASRPNGQHLAEGGANREEPPGSPARLMPREQWTRELQSLLELCTATNPDVDDSRHHASFPRSRS